VKNKTMMAAMEQAYRGMSMQGRFPGGIVNVEMPPELVDVNVHPAKTEVRFAHEQTVFAAVYRAVKATLLGKGSAAQPFVLRPAQMPLADADMQPDEAAARRPFAAPETSPSVDSEKPDLGIIRLWSKPGPGTPDTLESGGAEVAYQTKQTRPFWSELQPMVLPRAGSERALDIEADDEPQEAMVPAWVQQQTMETSAEGPALRLVGELFKTYIVAEMHDKLCLIDKHAAHERILYEKICAQRGKVASQQLLNPVSVALGAEEKNALLQNKESLEDAGVEVEDFGGSLVLVRGVPADVQGADIETLVGEVAARLTVNERDSQNEKTQWVLHSMACRAAMKAGDHAAPEELLALAADILSGEAPPFCPHGRPVVLEIGRKDLEKQFGRLGR
jgi:DNA mismatch repair protein MutL